MRDVCRWILVLMASLFILVGCEEQDSGTIDENGGEATWPYEGRDPNTYACNPIDPDNSGGAEDGLADDAGIIANLYYLPPELPNYTSVHDYVEFGTKVDYDIFFNQLNVPTRPFDRGFTTVNGVTITTPEGDTLYEWFALEFFGRIKLRDDQFAGDYQLAVLSDDGAVVEIDLDNDGTYETVIDNDGWTPTRIGCAVDSILFERETEYNYRIRYFQGPKYHIAFILMMRPLPDDPADEYDPSCGKKGNSLFFDSRQDPPEPQPEYLGLLDRGWAPLTPENFLLPASEEENPCNAPAPVISGLRINNIRMNEVFVSWATDIPSLSTVQVQEVLTGEVTNFDLGLTFATSHSLDITGLKSNTLYNLRVISASSSGLSSTSQPDISFRTRR
ncbi:MAG: hypothetical protein HRT45_02475 [Bdellovibrionales bacterium]|nr:hypothetical protein [Bdellovibrionales bacterium]